MAENLDTSDNTVPVITVPISYQPVAGPEPKAASFLDAFKTTKQSTTNTQISDSYNTNTSTVSSTSVGDSSLSIGQGGGTTETVALVVGAIALLGGIYLFTR